jgi:TonB family protein
MNKHIALVLLSLFLFLKADSQNMGIMFDTVYYQKGYVKVSKQLATFYRLPAEKIDSNHYQITYYNLKGVPQVTQICKPAFVNGQFSIEENVGIKDGQIMEYKDGLQYITGYFKDNIATGSWSSYFRNGKVHIIKTDNEEHNGYYYEEYDSIGKKLIEGAGKLTKRFKLDSGEFIELPKPHLANYGPWYYYNNNTGTLCKVISYKDGYKEGPCAYYDVNTKKKITDGHYLSGDRVGNWVYYDSISGKIKKTENYLYNKLNGNYTEYDVKSGKVIAIGEWKGGYMQGQWTGYYPGTDIVLIEIKCKNGKGYARIFDSSQSHMTVKEGRIINGSLEGEWKEYYKSSKKIAYKIRYNNSSLNGFEKHYDTLGNLISKLEFKNNIPVGNWKYYYPYSKKIWTKQKFIDSNQIHITSYYRNGKIKRKGIIKDKKIVEQKCFDEIGKADTCKNIYTHSKFFEDIGLYIKNHQKYPEVAIDLKIQGIVEIGFVITENGKVEDVRILKSVDKLLDNEAVRIISSMPAWQPAFIEETPVRSYEKVKIPFWLNNSDDREL